MSVIQFWINDIGERKKVEHHLESYPHIIGTIDLVSIAA
jgi:hypothetical protein